MSDSAMIIRDGAESHELRITSRDLGLLWGPFFVQGQVFINAFGVYENFTVAGGIPKGSHVRRGGRGLYGATAALESAIRRDEDLLRYDYSYGFQKERTRHGGTQSVVIRGRGGTLSTRPTGYCSIELYDWNAQGLRIAEFIDLRIVKNVKTDEGKVIKVYRRKAEMHWLERLPPFLNFLERRQRQELIVEHVDRV
jgi:hypothetical protein